jgi:hypothetical protein
VVDRPLLDTRLGPQGSHAGSEAGMARSFPASAPFCSPCSQAAEPNSTPRVAGRGFDGMKALRLRARPFYRVRE